MKTLLPFLAGFLLGVLLIGLIFMCVSYSLTKSLEYIQAFTPLISLILTLFVVTLAYAAIHTQRSLHRETNRPVVVCDFIILYQNLYFRIKNFGTSSACDISSSLTESTSATTLLKDKLEKKLPHLSPNAELLFFVCTPGNLPQDTVSLTVKYTNYAARDFTESYTHDLKSFAAVDIGHEYNSPLIQKLDAIAKALKNK